MQRRLETARAEVAAFAEYQYVVVNDELDACVDRLRAIVLAERARLRSARDQAEQIVGTFRQDLKQDG
jgi:guanylate kinase